MRKLSTETRAMILNALVEGNSVNATARLCGASKVTVLGLLADAGTPCGRLHDDLVRGLQAERRDAIREHAVLVLEVRGLRLIKTNHQFDSLNRHNRGTQRRSVGGVCTVRAEGAVRQLSAKVSGPRIEAGAPVGC